MTFTDVHTDRQKLDVILGTKVFQFWSYQKMYFTKNVFLNWYSSMKFFFRKIQMIFDIENSLWKSNFRTLRRAGKARQSIPGRLKSGRMANFESCFEKWGRRRCRFRPSWHYYQESIMESEACLGWSLNDLPDEVILRVFTFLKTKG